MVSGLLFDIEGTLVGDKRFRPTPGAVAFVRRLRGRGLPMRLITNNTTDRPAEIIRKLGDGGFDFRPEELFTCISAAIGTLQGRGARRCYVIGTDDLRAQLAEGGLTVCETAEVDAVVVGLDFGLTYERLRTATEALIGHGAALVALHRNRVLHDAQGRIAPSVGALAEALAFAAEVEPLVIGKPSPNYYRQALDDIGLPPDQVVVVSDDPLTDLAGAKRMGMKAAFVLVGKYPDRRVLDRVRPEERPDVVANRLGELEGTSLFRE